MSHVEEGTLQAWIDGELAEAGVAEVQVHAAQCASCAAEVRALREADARVRDLLGELPDTVVADFATLAEIRRRARSRSIRRFVPASLARAAMLLLALAGVVAAAIPDSPLRRWLADIVTDSPGAAEAPASEPVAPATPPAAAPIQETGRALALDAGRVVIHLVAPSRSIEIRLRLVDDDEASVTWNAVDADARTRQTAGQLEIYGLDSGPVTISIPRHAVDALVEVDGQVWWHKQGGDIRIPGPAHEDTGDGVVFSARS